MPSPGKIPGTVAKFSQPRIPVPGPRQREEHAPRAELGVDRSTQAHSPRRWGEGRAERGPGSWRGANWESGVVCWLRPLPEGGGEPYISAVVALDVLFRNGFAVRTQVSCGCGFRRPGAEPCSERAGLTCGCRRQGLAVSIPTSSVGQCGRESARPSGNPVASPRVRLEA